MLTPAQALKQQIKEANEKIAALNAQLQGVITSIMLPKIGKSVKVVIGEEKGNIIIYGLQRMPYCFYANQAVKMREILNSPEFVEFIEKNKAKLSVKEDKTE